jgi:hypothetical protein
VKTVYLIPPQTRVAISTNGSDFKLTTLRRQMQFESPPELTGQHATFEAGQPLSCVPLNPKNRHNEKDGRSDCQSPPSWPGGVAI